MALVSYSESEGSDEEEPWPQTTTNTQPTTNPETKLTVDKSKPRKIRVSLQETQTEPPINGGLDGEPAHKRPKVGGGFSGFNSMLPAPKRDIQSASETKAATIGSSTKVFNLKTGAEPGFNRASDAELRQQLRERDNGQVEGGLAVQTGAEQDVARTRQESELRSIASPPLSKQGNAMLFKPLSVARSAQRRKTPAKLSAVVPASQLQLDKAALAPHASPAVPKVHLFSISTSDEPFQKSNMDKGIYEPIMDQEIEGSDEIDPIHAIATDKAAGSHDPNSQTISDNSSQSLDSIAADLNLSASAKRQLLGRNHKDAAKSPLLSSTSTPIKSMRQTNCFVPQVSMSSIILSEPLHQESTV